MFKEFPAELVLTIELIK